MRRLQRQFPNRNVHYCQRCCSNLNHTGHTYHAYCNYCSLSYCLSARVLWFGNCLWNPLIVSRTLPVSVYLGGQFIFRKCGLECAPTIFVQFFYFLLHSFAPLFSFTYRKTLEQVLDFDYVTRVIIPLIKG